MMMPSVNHDDLAHLKIPLESILSATNNFDDENFRGGGRFGNHYAGQLLWSGESIDIHAQRWNKEWNEKEQQFWMEISMLSSLEHKNLVSLVGFCDENDEKIIVIKLESMFSLDNYFSDSLMLTWVRRLEICVGVAHALSYIHYDELRDFSVIHQNIESETVLLNDKCEPKLSEFRLSMKIEASRRHHSFHVDKVCDRDGYTDPTYIETKSISHKSDIYSFGIVMFELLCSRKAVINDDQDNKYLAPMAITHYREEKMEDLVEWNLWKQIDPQSFKVFTEIAYDCLNEERSQRPSIDEIVPKLEKALKLACENRPMMSLPSNQFGHLKIPLESILSATNNFDEENGIRYPEFAIEYTGQLLWSGELIEITAKRFNKERKDLEQQFWMEISLLSSLKHKNVVSLVGFCDENDEKVIVYKNETRGMLNEYLSDPTLLTWVRRLEISVGIAHALSYIHYDEPRDFSVIHRSIDSSRVLLNDEWEPKLYGFEDSMKIKASQRHHSFHTTRLAYVMGYVDPTYLETKIVSHKSDIYSFGIVLFELLCGRLSIIDSDTDKYLARVAITHYREKKLEDIIDWDLRQQMDSESFNIFAETAYECLNEERSQRTNIDESVPKLEKALKLACENRPVISLTSNEFAHLKVPLESILSATNNFDEQNVINTCDFGKRYKGQLLWSGELIHITAKRFNKERNDREQLFWTEISVLSSLKHKNVVSFVGFCDENDEKIIIYRNEMARGMLYTCLSDPMLLTWLRRLEICVGLAHALSYIHYDEPRDFSVIHRLISSSRVVLNDEWEPKLCDFEFSMKIKASQRHHSFHANIVKGVKGYVDPTYIETKRVSHKADMYSFGIVLFELLCGRESIIGSDTDKYLASLATAHYREKRLDEIIDWDLWKQMDSQSFDIYAKTAYDCLNEERSRRPNIDEIAKRLEKALEHQKAIVSLPSNEFAHLKLPLEDILSATNNFDEQNVIETADFGNIYKGQLLRSGVLINVNARRIKKERKQAEQEFWTEISMLASLKHKNLVSLVGFCDENDEKVIINMKETRGWLDEYLHSSVSLTWVRRLNVSVGLAHALSYIYHDEPRAFSVIHRDIRSFTVQLNDDWEPKLSNFERSMKIKASQRHHSLHTNTLKYTNGYGDPTYLETKNVNHKSDIYSFGIVLLEVLCGRKSIMDNDNNKYLAPLAITYYREKKLHEIIDWDLWEQMDSQAFDIFTETAYGCLNEEQSQRPNIDAIVTRLEKALELQLEHQNEVISLTSNEFAHLKVPLESIISATNNFDEENEIRYTEFAKEYKGRLLWSGELIHITAKRFNKEWNDREQLFWTEISMLSSLKHKNVVSLVGFCDENDEKIIIYMYETRGMLDEYLSDPMLLTWVRRLEICVGLANALSYIHYDESRDFSVIHRFINCVLLNDDWEPKLCGFEDSMKIKASQRHHSFHTSVKGVNGYVDPTYLETKIVSHKSDIYSFGIVLFELMCGRKSIIDGQDNKYLVPVAIFHYKKKMLDEIIDPVLWKQMDPQSFNAFAKTAYECLNEEQSQRPNIDEIVARLERALKFQMERQNDANSILAAKVADTSSNHDKGSLTSISTRVESHVSKETKSFLKDLSHLKLSFEDIKSATNNLGQEDSLDEGKLIFEGHLLRSEHYVDIFGKIYLYDSENDESKRFWMELSILSSLKHKNLVSLIGFYEEKYEEKEVKIIIYKREANGSLKTYLSDQTLTWMQRLKISVGVAKVLSYLHYDPERDFSVIHCNIRSSKILLDDKWEPKLFGFELSLKNTVARRHRLLLTHDVNENEYLDPKYKKTGGLTHKSDVYSFGVVLFEVLCGISARDEDENEDKEEDENEDEDEEDDEEGNENEDEDEDKDENKHENKADDEEDDNDELEEGLLSKLDKSHLDDMIMPHLRKQMDQEAFKIFSDTAYWCIKEDRADRPYIDQVVKRLEKALELQWIHENPVNGRSSIQLKGNLEHLKIRLNDIKEATKNFDAAYCIGSGGFGKVYKADLEVYFDCSNSSSKEGVDKCNLPRKRSTVAIKRITHQEGEEGFIAEIETLTSCKHENIISLLGFCYEGNGAMILVYEHASKGSLESYLGSSDKMANLNWLQRLNICLDIAHGLSYIHNNTDHGKQKMIHRDIKSDNILLGDNWKAKIADFGLSKFHPADQDASTFIASTIAGTCMYLDPEYEEYGKLNKKSDIYSFGVVLLEILTGRLAYDSVYTKVNEKGLAPIARDHLKKGRLMELVDHKIKEETDEHVFSLSKGPNKESLDIFLEITFQCVAETQAQRPTIEVVINELKKALDSQENHKDNLKLSLEDIQSATKGFSQDNIIGQGDSGNVYKGSTHSTHGYNNIAAKRLDKKWGQGEAEVLTELVAPKFMAELDILMEYKHLNVIGLVGYCDEEDEKIIVYEYASRGSLDKYLSDDSLTWVMRLKICIDIAIGLEFLHGNDSSSEMVIHRDISSSNILLSDEWIAKITGFGLSLLSSEKLDDEYHYLPFLAKHHYHEEKLDKLVFKGIKEQIVPQSFITFADIAYRCIHHMRERRPTAEEVVIQLKKALEFHEDFEEWEPKLPRDYKEIIKMSKCPEIYSTKKKEELYNIFSNGILLQHDKVLLSFVGNGERNEMVSATMFSYINSCPHKLKSLKESSFGTVVKILDISNLFIEIKTRAQFLSPNVVYGVYLVFNFCDSRNFSSKPMCVNLKYRKGRESMHAYFATWRDEQWMMIELQRFLSQKEDVVLEFLLESFSSYYCGDAAVYVEGIEFRPIDKVKHEEIGKLKEVQQVLKSDFKVDQVQQLPTNFEEIFKVCRNYDELFWLGEVDGKKLLVLSAKAALYKFSNVDTFTSKPPAQSRFQEVIELLLQQVFHINCTVISQMLSPDTEYVCNLLFKLSENCRGMHCPVKVRDVLHHENKEAEFLYFITPEPSNIHDITRVPKQREDGWMEIQLWKFNSAHEFKDDSLSMNMKFTSHEGTMSGLIICGLEFRPTFTGNSDDIQRQSGKKRMLQDEAQNPHIQPKKDEKRTEL